MATEEKQRLTTFLKHKKLSLSKFADKCSLDKSILSRISETTSQSTLKRIEDNSDLNIDWLLTGEGEMLRHKPNENPEKNRKIEDAPTEHDRLIPFYDVETTGGYSGTVSASDSGDMVGYIQPGGWFDGHETAAIRHVGDSMAEYPNGCILAVREVLDRHLLVPGRNYVIETSEYRVTKRLQRGHSSDTIMLYSTNTDKYEDGRLIHEPFEISLTDVRRIFSVLGYIVNQAGEFRLIKP